MLVFRHTTQTGNPGTRMTKVQIPMYVCSCCFVKNWVMKSEYLPLSSHLLSITFGLKNVKLFLKGFGKANDGNSRAVAAVAVT